MAKPNQETEMKRARVVSFAQWVDRRGHYSGWASAERKPSFRVSYLTLVPELEMEDDEPEFAA